MKVLKRGLLILLIGVIVAIVLPWLVFPVLNDIKANTLKCELLNELLPKNTKVIEALSGSGNTGGTGDHTEIWAGILIKTELPEDEITNIYGNNIQKVDESKQSTFIMDLLGRKFSKLQGISEYEGYYIVERIDNAVSSFFDIRGS